MLARLFVEVQLAVACLRPDLKEPISREEVSPKESPSIATSSFQAKASEEEKPKYCFKLVAVVGSRLFSIYDGKTEYIIGEKKTTAGDDMFYAYATIEEAASKRPLLPRDSRMRQTPRAIISVRAEHEAQPRLSNGKLCFRSITPLQIVQRLKPTISKSSVGKFCR